MSITFHCSYCNKKIIAKDGAGGKRGKCPSCHNKIYVPNLNPDEDEGELTFAPIDEQERKRKKDLLQEGYQLSQEILKERAEPNKNVSQHSTSRPAAAIDPSKIKDTIIICLRKMADGKLAESDTIARSIASIGPKGRDELDTIALSDIPDQKLADIPPGVLAGLIRTLRGKIR
jgi:phage FluMu protein Com